MTEPERKQWHQQNWVRALILLLIPAIALSLYLFSTQIALRRPVTVPATPETPDPGTDPET